jgi:hypothetical protein
MHSTIAQFTRRATTVAATIVLVTFATGARADTTPATSRIELAPTPTPSPLAKPVLLESASVRGQRTLDVKQITAQHRAALRLLQPRTFTRRSVAMPSAHQDIQVLQRDPTAGHSLDYCAAHPLEVDHVSGDVTVEGILTITGLCFGSSGKARITGHFADGGFDLETLSWSDTVVKARLNGVYGVDGQGPVDQPVDLRLMTQRGAARTFGASPYLKSAPVRLNFVAVHATVSAIGYVGIDACASGETLPQVPDDCGESAWGARNCELGNCMTASHVRKAAGSGEDVYSLRVGHGFVLDRVVLLGDAADVVFDPSLDPTHVTFRVRWRTVHKSDPALVQRGYPQYADYHDGSYMLYPTITGPVGVRP